MAEAVQQTRLDVSNLLDLCAAKTNQESAEVVADHCRSSGHCDQRGLFHFFKYQVYSSHKFIFFLLIAEQFFFVCLSIFIFLGFTINFNSNFILISFFDTFQRLIIFCYSLILFFCKMKAKNEAPTEKISTKHASFTNFT